MDARPQSFFLLTVVFQLWVFRLCSPLIPDRLSARPAKGFPLDPPLRFGQQHDSRPHTRAGCNASGLHCLFGEDVMALGNEGARHIASGLQLHTATVCDIHQGNGIREHDVVGSCKAFCWRVAEGCEKKEDKRHAHKSPWPSPPWWTGSWSSTSVFVCTSLRASSSCRNNYSCCSCCRCRFLRTALRMFFSVARLHLRDVWFTYTHHGPKRKQSQGLMTSSNTTKSTSPLTHVM